MIMQLKNVVLIILTATQVVLGANTIPISVLKFTDKSALSGDTDNGCYSWYYFGPARLGSAFQERLVAEMVKDQRFSILERESIKAVHDNEIELLNSHNAEPIERGYFQRAKYTLVGVVKTFDWCVGGEAGHVNLGSLFGIGDLEVGAKRNSAKVVVEVRVIDTRTGKVLKSVTGSGEKSSYKFGFEGEIKRVNLGSKKFKDSSLGEAIDEAISEAASELKKDFPKGS